MQYPKPVGYDYADLRVLRTRRGGRSDKGAQAAYDALLPHLRRRITPDGDSVSFWDFSLGL